MSGEAAHVVLVEDDDVDVIAMKRAFRSLGVAHRIQTVRSGRSALQMLRAGQIQRPCVILLDLNLPSMSGFEFLEELRADPVLFSTPVFVYSTSADERDVTSAYRLRIAGYIVKPVSQPKLIEVAQMLSSYWNVVMMP